MAAFCAKEKYLFPNNRKNQLIFCYDALLLRHNYLSMSTPQQEYQQELKKVQDSDFTHNWVSSSAFIFYLSITCILALSLGGCYKLYNERFEKPNVPVQESSLYTPKYK